MRFTHGEQKSAKLRHTNQAGSRGREGANNDPYKQQDQKYSQTDIPEAPRKIEKSGTRMATKIRQNRPIAGVQGHHPGGQKLQMGIVNEPCKQQGKPTPCSNPRFPEIRKKHKLRVTMTDSVPFNGFTVQFPRHEAGRILNLDIYIYISTRAGRRGSTI